MIFPVKVPYTIGIDIKKYDGSVLDDYLDPEYVNQKEKEFRSWHPMICKTSDEKYNHYLSAYTGHEGDLKEIALQMNEDVAILKDGIVKNICFTFPSGFIPELLVGKNLFQIHAPVPEGDRLRKSSDNLIALMTKDGGVFRRFVWSLSSLKSLSQLPGKIRPKPVSIDDI